MGREQRNNPLTQQRTGLQSGHTYDRFHREITEGDHVYILGKGDVFWKVLRVRALLDPTAPPGAIEIVFSTQVASVVPGGQAISDVIKCLDAQQIAEAQAAMQPDPAPRADRQVIPVPGVPEA